MYSGKRFREKLLRLGLDYVCAKDKKIPWSILQSPKNVVLAFLCGLFEGDGSCFLFKNRDRLALGVAYYSVSETLCRDVHIVLDKLGYDGYINFRNSKINDKKQWFVRLNGQYAYDFAKLMNIERFQNKLSLFCVTKPHKNIVWLKEKECYRAHYIYCGKRYQRTFHKLCEAENFVKHGKSLPRFRHVKSVTLLSQQQKLYDYHLPQTHSFYACGSRQHNSIPLEVYEVVIRGFGAVSAKPHERVQELAKIAKMRELGNMDQAQLMENELGFGNQVVLSGTTDYVFNHFYKYWTKYKAFIESRGDVKKLREFMGDSVPEDFNWKDYSIIRLPYTKVPRGFLDETQIAQGRATMDKSTFIREYAAGWPRDTAGFYKRSVIELCTCKPVVKVENSEISFRAKLNGDKGLRYVIGVDPASEHDNFAIVVLELNEYPKYKKIIYCWTMNRLRLRNKLKKEGKETDVNFYSFCAKKLRDLSYRFSTDHIGIDSQGGGVSIFEALHDTTQLDQGELKYWPYIKTGDNDVFWWEKSDKPTDGETGAHNLHVINFADANFVREANHGLRFDFENKLTLFPCYDALTFTSEDITATDWSGDSLDDCYMEIEELKNELSSIIHTQTLTGRDKWDTPEVKLPGNKKGRLRKDRYSALLIANQIARVLGKEELGQVHYQFVGGYVGNKIEKQSSGNEQLYIGPSNVVSQIKGVYGAGVFRR
jgi:hypothetical protein